jgi:AcrR family transcriptional regulator
MTKNAIPEVALTTPDIAARIAQQTLARRGGEYTDEVRRLLDAALAVMRDRGTGAKPRVADIVAAAGLSNDAFYRHFRSKDALVTAILEDGTGRLVSYLAHQMAKATTPEDQVRRWVTSVLAQAHGDTAASTLAVLWNAGAVGDGPAAGRHFASAPLAELLHAPFTALGSTTPELDATLVAHAVLGVLSDHLWQRTQSSRGELERIVAFCIDAPSSSAKARA